MHNHIYSMVLFICNYEFDTDKLERALISLIDIIFSGRFNFYHKYKVLYCIYQDNRHLLIYVD